MGSKGRQNPGGLSFAAKRFEPDRGTEVSRAATITKVSYYPTLVDDAGTIASSKAFPP